jgi:hypothetical protein
VAPNNSNAIWRRVSHATCTHVRRQTTRKIIFSVRRVALCCVRVVASIGTIYRIEKSAMECVALAVVGSARCHTLRMVSRSTRVMTRSPIRCPVAVRTSIGALDAVGR